MTKPLALVPGSPAIYFTDDVVINDITKFSALDFAKQITLIEITLFKSIQPEELKSLKWNGKEKMQHAPNIVASTRFFNQQSFWVQKEILRYRCVIKRTEILSFFIKIIKKLTSLNNLQSAMAILCALQVDCIYRLSHTWNALTNKDRTTFNRLEALFSQDDNFRRQREYLNSSCLPGIPYIGVYLSDLTYINVAHPRVDGQPSPLFTQKVNAVVNRFVHFQQSEYSFTVLEQLNTYLCSQSYVEELQAFIAEENYSASLALEPGTTSMVTQLYANKNKKLEPSPSISLTSAVSTVTSMRRDVANKRPPVAEQRRLVYHKMNSFPSLDSTPAYSRSLDCHERRCYSDFRDPRLPKPPTTMHTITEDNQSEPYQSSVADCLESALRAIISDRVKAKQSSRRIQLDVDKLLFQDVPTLTLRPNLTSGTVSSGKCPGDEKFILQLLFQGVVERRHSVLLRSSKKQSSLSKTHSENDAIDSASDFPFVNISLGSLSNLSEAGSSSLPVSKQNSRQCRLKKMFSSGSWKRFWANLIVGITGDGQISAFIVYFESNSRYAVDRSQFTESKSKVQCLLTPSSTFTVPATTHRAYSTMEASDHATELLHLLTTLASHLSDARTSNLYKHGFLSQVKPIRHRQNVGELDCFYLSDPSTGKAYLLRPIPSVCDIADVTPTASQKIMPSPSVKQSKHNRSPWKVSPSHSKDLGGLQPAAISPYQGSTTHDSRSSSRTSCSTGQSRLVNQWIENINSIFKKVMQ